MMLLSSQLGELERYNCCLVVWLKICLQMIKSNIGSLTQYVVKM